MGVSIELRLVDPCIQIQTLDTTLQSRIVRVVVHSRTDKVDRMDRIDRISLDKDCSRSKQAD